MAPPFFRHSARIGFRDTDAAGRAHFASILEHVENAEHACLRALGLTVFSLENGGWPRARVECDYRRPLLPEERIEVRLAVESLGGSSVAWRFDVRGEDGASAACGRMVTVRVDSRGRPRPLCAEEVEKLRGPGPTG